MGVAICRAVNRRSVVSLGQRLELTESSTGGLGIYYASPGRRNGFPQGRQSIRCTRYGWQCVAVDRRIPRPSYSSRHPSRWSRLSTEWFALVFPADLSTG